MQTEAGAVAFVKFYFEQVNKAWMTPDDTLLPPLAENGCQSCATLQKYAEDLVAKEQRLSSPATKIPSAGARSGAPTGQQFVTIQMDVLGAETVDASGKVVDRDEVASVKREAVVKWQEGRWLLYGISD